ncbi:MAG: hypothetical protein ACI8SE_001335 [Bacteroidia bacterium]
MAELTERYKKLSTNELLMIIEEPGDYTKIAVETANAEIDSRGLDEHELEVAKFINAKHHQREIREVEKRKQRVTQMKERLSHLIENGNPFQNGIETPEKIVRLTTWVLGLYTICIFYLKFGFIRFMFTHVGARWDLDVVIQLLPLVVLPIALFLFWTKKKIGWILLTVYLSFSIALYASFFMVNFGLHGSEYFVLDFVFSNLNQAVYVGMAIFMGIFISLIGRPEIRKLFKISSQTMYTALLLTAAVTSYYVYSSFG